MTRRAAATKTAAAKPKTTQPATARKPARKRPAAKTTKPVVTPKDPFQRRSDADPVPGESVRVTSGEHEGRVGVYDSVLDVDKDGHAKRAGVDFGPYVLAVDYDRLERAPRTP